MTSIFRYPQQLKNSSIDLRDFIRDLVLLLALYHELQLGSTEDLQPEIKKWITEVSKITRFPEDLPEALEKVIDKWRGVFARELRAKSNIAWGAGYLGYLLWLTKANYERYCRPDPVLMQGVSMEAELLKRAFPPDTTDLLMHSLKDWEKFTQNLTSEQRDHNSDKIKLAVGQQFYVWQDLLLGEKTPKSFLSRWHNASIVVLSGLVAFGMIFLFLALLWTLLLLFHLNLSLDTFTKFDDASKLVISGGLSAIVSGLVYRIPFGYVRDWIEDQLIKRSVVRLPHSVRDSIS